MIPHSEAEYQREQRLREIEEARREERAATSAPAPESVAAKESEDVETGASEAQTAKDNKEEIDG
jgi:hypothetical protein